MYHLQKLENISGRHLTAYVLQMQEDGKSPSTIKTDLAAIRFFHDKMSRPKYRLPSNDELAVELERRCFGGVDRTVPINEQIALALRQQLERTPRGHKLLVPDGTPTEQSIHAVQLFILKHRADVRGEGSDRPLSFHGLRHTYAAEKYQELVNGGWAPWTPTSPCPGSWAMSGRT